MSVISEPHIIAHHQGSDRVSHVRSSYLHVGLVTENGVETEAESLLLSCPFRALGVS